MQQYTTAPYVRVFFNKSVLSVGAASIQKNITDPQQQDIILGLLSFFLMPSSLERATIHMASNDNKDAIQPILDISRQQIICKIGSALDSCILILTCPIP